MEDQKNKELEAELGQTHLRLLRDKYLLVEEQTFCEEIYFHSKLVLYFVTFKRFDEMAIFGDVKGPGKVGPELKPGEISFFQDLENLVTVERPNEKSYLAAVSDVSDQDRITYSLGLSKFTLNYLASEGIDVEIVEISKDTS